MVHSDLTREILDAAFDVSNELGAGFLESVYEKALLVCLGEKGLRAENQKPLDVRFRSHVVGSFFADIVVEGCVILELKAAKDLAPDHEAQLLNYLNATGLPVGLLLNFGNPKLQYRRFENRFNSLKVFNRD